VTSISAPLVPGDEILFAPLNSKNSGVSLVGQVLDIKMSIFLFIIAALSVFGWVFFVIFGGLGLISLPVDLINAYRERPREIKQQTYEDRKVKIGERAEDLLKTGLSMDSKKMKRKEKNEWKKQVFLLDKEFISNEIAFKMKGGPLIVYIFRLIAGIFCICLTILWVIQIVIWTNLHIYPLLNYMLMAMSGIWSFFAVLFFALLAYYFLLCVMKGNFKFGLRIPFIIALYPMEPDGTLMSSMLVNTNLILIASVAVTHFCAESFSLFTRDTYAYAIFNVAIQNLRGLYWYWYVIHWVLIGIIVLCAIYFIIRPTDRNTKIYMKAQQRR